MSSLCMSVFKNKNFLFDFAKIYKTTKKQKTEEEEEETLYHLIIISNSTIFLVYYFLSDQSIILVDFITMHINVYFIEPGKILKNKNKTKIFN